VIILTVSIYTTCIIFKSEVEMSHNYYLKDLKESHKTIESCEKNGVCEIKVGRNDFFTIHDCECKVEIDFDLHKCYDHKCDNINKESFFENASIECQCFPECPELLYSLV
jgi:hypothetical protein